MKRRFVALLGAGLVTMTACTSAPTGAGRHSAASTPGAGPTIATWMPSSTPTGAPTGGSGVGTSTATGTAPGSAPPTATASALPKDYCSPSALSVRAINGSGSAGIQYALIMFTNKGSKSCSLSGYPGVSLLAGGRALATAGRSPGSTGTVQLAPGGRAQASVTDASTCQAALSDTLRVYPPNLTVYYESPIQLRGCALTVGSVQPA